MYKIEFTMDGVDGVSTLSYATRESATAQWDKFCDMAEGGDSIKLFHPKGSEMSSYRPLASKKQRYPS